MSVDIVHGSMLDLLPRWTRDGLRVGTIITDPPYHLSAIQKRSTGPDARGFMGSHTDEGDISFRPETWRLCLDILEPGGRLACFGGTRTFWRMATAIDAAGFEYEDTIAWVYAQGLVLRRSRLKPCWEPIMLFRKPGPVRDLGIDECRVPSSGGRYREDEASQNERYKGKGGTNFAALPDPRGGDSLGRWPGNLIHDGSDDVLACLPDSPGQIAATRADGTPKRAHVYGAVNHDKTRKEPRKDSGSAARFFTECAFSEEEKRIVYCPKAPSRERCYHCAICDQNCLHIDRREHAHGRDDLTHLHAHPTLKPITLMRHLVKLLAPSESLVLDPFAGTGTTLLAAKLECRDVIGIERDERYAAHCRLRVA